MEKNLSEKGIHSNCSSQRKLSIFLKLNITWDGNRITGLPRMIVTEYWFAYYPLWRIVMNLKCKCRQMFKMINIIWEKIPIFTTGVYFMYYFKNFQQRMLRLLHNRTYGSRSREEMMEFRTLSVTLRRLSLDASSLLFTSGYVRACSAVTS